jgi:hypothetical protein
MNELELQLLLETVDKTPYLGAHSDLVSGIRKKITIKPNPNNSDDPNKDKK